MNVNANLGAHQLALLLQVRSVSTLYRTMRQTMQTPAICEQMCKLRRKRRITTRRQKLYAL